jgi:hypothetical protein
MWRWVLSLPLLTIVLAAPVVSQPPKDEKQKTSGLEIGKDLPGPFRPYNVTGDRAGRFHCLVTQSSLDPLVLIFTKWEGTYPEALRALEEGLDTRIAKNPNVRLNSFTVFMSPDLPKVVADTSDIEKDAADEKEGKPGKRAAEIDDKRDKIADDLRAVAKDLKNVVFCLDSSSDLADYKLDDNAWTTVVLVKGYKVVAVHKYMRDKLDGAAVEQILGEVGQQLGATRK